MNNEEQNEHFSKVPSRINGKQNPEYYRKYYKRNKKEILEQNKEWRKRNPDKYRQLCNLDYRQMVISLLRQRDGNFCGICKLIIFENEETIDHIQPRCCGGGNEATNLRLSHKSCNQRRERSTWQRDMS